MDGEGFSIIAVEQYKSLKDQVFLYSDFKLDSEDL
jgi:hypothetical protein